MTRSPNRRGLFLKRSSSAVAAAALILAAGCQASDADSALSSELAEPNLAFVEGDTPGSGATTTTTQRRTTTTSSPPIELGTPSTPFGPLPISSEARAIETASGVVLPVLGQRDGAYLALTACEEVRVMDGTPIGRAHVVLDPGHGGTEVGAASELFELAEEHLNLQVALLTKQRLEAAGATVVLTRSFDHNITTGARGVLAKSIEPALFVSVHHNGGSPRLGDRPGTMAFAKDDDASRRFGGLFYKRLTEALAPLGAQKRADYALYHQALEDYETALDAFGASVQARDEALVANGQALPEATTTLPPRPEPDALGRRSARQLVTTPTTLMTPTTQAPTTQPPTTQALATDDATSSTTQPASTSTSLLPVPSTVAPPAEFTLEPVAPFGWTGSGNAGVRAWLRADGKDYLSVLRHSADIPTVLAEFLYLTNPVEAELLADPGFLALEAEALATAIIDYFSSEQAVGTGHVPDEFDDQPIGGGGKPKNCVEPDYDLPPPTQRPAGAGS